MTRKIRLWRCAVLAWSCLCIVQAGPVDRHVRVVREVYPEIEPEKVEGNQAQVCIVGDVIYGLDETVPADEPCFTCKCQPPGLHCETKRCETKSGCKAIHKPNKCCPDYQCECEHEGKIYANGERLETMPGGECKVCYCRGGEVQCAEVSCYIRTDCEGRTVPGQCCPKYEHCPPIEPTLDKIPLKPEPHDNKTTVEATTRPTIDPSLNSSVENEIVETTTYSARERTSDPPKAANASDDDLILGTASNDISTNEKLKEDKSSQTEDAQKDEPAQITIHEIIPDVKEIPMTESPKQDTTNAVQGLLVVEEAVPTSAESANVDNQSNDLGISDSDLGSSEVSEVYQHPPPILRIGDKLLFLKKGEFVPEEGASTPSSVFTIIGAEGLQRGDIESVEHHEVIQEQEEAANETSQTLTTSEVEIATENRLEQTKGEPLSNVQTTETPTTASAKVTNKDGVEIENDNATAGKISIEQVPEQTAQVENKVTPTTEISSQEARVSEGLNAENSTIDVAVELATILDVPAASEDTEWLEVKTVTKGSGSTTTEKLETSTSPSQPPEVPTDNNASETVEDGVKTKQEEGIHLENPAYPPIPDIMSPQEREDIPESPEHAEEELSKLVVTAENDAKEISASPSDNSEQIKSEKAVEKEPRNPSIYVINAEQSKLKKGVESNAPAHDETKLDEAVDTPKSSENVEHVILIETEGNVTQETSKEVTPVEADKMSSEIQGEPREELKVLAENSPKNTEESEDENAKETSQLHESGRILPEILEIRNNHTIPPNVNNSEWLKDQGLLVEPLINEEAALPDFILKQVAPSDMDITTDDSLLTTINESNEIGEEVTSSEATSSRETSTESTVENLRLRFGTIIENESLTKNHLKKLAEEDENYSGIIMQVPAEGTLPQDSVRSTETLEDTAGEDSGENVTSKDVQHASLISSEDASIEMEQRDSDETHSSEASEELSGNGTASSEVEAKASDVEIIDPLLLLPNSSEHEQNVTHEEEAKTKQKSDDHIEKRTVNANYDPESERIFQELDDEIHLISGESNNVQTGEEEKKEAEVIFKELLDEVHSPPTKSPPKNPVGPESRETAVLQRVSDAIAKFQLKDARQSLDTSILSILRDFFSSQYRSYKDK